MTVKNDAEFDKKNWFLVQKKSRRNLVNFNASSDKPENVHFHVLLLSIAYIITAKKVQKNYL